jgi:hypothetical protein
MALELYPLAFRRRYGQEMRALLDECPVRALTILDLLRGAIWAHVRPPASAAGLLSPADRVRSSTSGLLACWVLFAAAGFGFYKTTEDSAFRAAGHAHPVLAAAHVAVQVLAVLASAAVLLGALPLIRAAVVGARRDRPLRLLVCVPPLAVILFAILTSALVVTAHAHAGNAAGRGAFLAWEIAGLACGAVCVWASRGALFAAQVPRESLLAALAMGTLVAAAMVAVALAAAVYSLALTLDSSGLATAPNGPLRLLSVGASLGGQVLVMAAASAMGVAASTRGWRAARGPGRTGST